MPAELDLTLVAVLPGGTPYAGTYELAVGSCTGRDDLDVRREVGYSLLALIQEADTDRGMTLTLVCVVAWLVRRRQFPHLLFDDVLRSVPWGSDFELNIPEQATEPEGKAESGNDTPEP